MLGGREVYRHAGTGIEAIQPPPGGLEPGAEERQPMGLGDDKVGGEERNTPLEGLAEEAVGVAMVLIASAAERDPGAAIDEQPFGSVGGGPGREPAARQRMSR